jgi:hypothetical protein
MKNFIYATSFTLAIATIAGPAMAQRTAPERYLESETRAPRIVDTNINYSNRAHEFTLYTGAAPLNALVLTVPANANVGQNVRVTTENGEQINTNVTQEGGRLLVELEQPIPAETTYNVDVRGIRGLSLYPRVGPTTFFYGVDGVHTGFSQPVPYGLALFTPNFSDNTPPIRPDQSN